MLCGARCWLSWLQRLCFRGPARCALLCAALTSCCRCCCCNTPTAHHHQVLVSEGGVPYLVHGLAHPDEEVSCCCSEMLARLASSHQPQPLAAIRCVVFCVLLCYSSTCESAALVAQLGVLLLRGLGWFGTCSLSRHVCETVCVHLGLLLPPSLSPRVVQVCWWRACCPAPAGAHALCAPAAAPAVHGVSPGTQRW